MHVCYACMHMLCMCVLWLIPSPSFTQHTPPASPLFHGSRTLFLFCSSVSKYQHLFFLLLFKHSYLLLSHHQFPLPHPPPPPTLNPSPLWLCSWVLYTCSSKTLPFLFPIIPSTLPSGYCQFVLCFSVSGSILLTCLFSWLDSSYRWDHMLLFFHLLENFT